VSLNSPRCDAPETGSRGQILVLFVGGLVTLVLLVGLVIDGGVAFLQRRNGQNIADLAALTATKVIADHYTDAPRTGADVFGALDDAAVANGCVPAGTPCTWTADYIDTSERSLGAVVDGGSIPATAQGVVVRVTRQPSTYFLGVVGQTTWQVNTEATALTAALDVLPPGQVLPIAADPPGAYLPGTTYRFTAGKDGPGNFGWLSWTGSNDPNTLAASICDPNNPLITFPQEIPGDPGKSNSIRVRDCLDEWIRTGATVLIPIWAPSSGGSCATGGNGNNFVYCIVGLAAFQMTYRSQPAIDEIWGVFQEYYPYPSVPPGYGRAPTPGDSAFFLGLVR